MSVGTAVGTSARVRASRGPGRAPGASSAAMFWLPAAILIGVWMLYPAVATVYRSFFDSAGSNFIGLDNYSQIFRNSRIVTTLENNAVWVIVFPALVTALGVLFAVLLERVQYRLALRTILFMPMAISLLASGVIWRIVYQPDPKVGILNAGIASVSDRIGPPGAYQGARPSQPTLFANPDGAWRLNSEVSPGDIAKIGLIGFPVSELPSDARQAVTPTAAAGEVDGVVWRDFTAGGGSPGAVDPGEKGIPKIRLDLVDGSGNIAGTTTSGADGRFAFTNVKAAAYHVQADSVNFRPAFSGIDFLGHARIFGRDIALVTPAIIVAAIWVWVGFATVTMSAGLATLPRDTLEAARIDGSSEFQIFKNVTVPLLAPLMMVTFITLTINALKIFDLVLAITPGPSLPDANVIALEMYLVSFTGLGNQGLGSSLAVLLFILMLPVMAFQVRRFRAQQQA
jgi:alpha-glucoside transport system permease protein